jgi:hypothetical protein
MSNRLVLITSLPISSLFVEKVGVDRFRKLGFDTNLLDASSQYHSRESLEAYYAGHIAYRSATLQTTLVDSRKKMWSAMESLTQGDVVWHLSRFFKSVEDDCVFAMLNKKDIPYYLQHFDPISSPIRFAKKIRMQARMCRQKYLNWNLSPRGVVGSGLLGRRQSEFLYPRSRFLSIPSVKVLWSPTEPVVSDEYILFVDENVEYAPDARLLGYSVSHDIDGYYARMNRLFTMLEMWFGKPVIVAASGKYKYTNDRFQGRKLIYGKTLPLIQHASLVIGHMSLALEQCLVSEVPFVIVDDQSFSIEKRAGFDESLLNRLQKPILNTEITRVALTSYAVPEIRKMRTLVRNFLKEDEVSATYHEVVAAEFNKYQASASSFA